MKNSHGQPELTCVIVLTHPASYLVEALTWLFRGNARFLLDNKGAEVWCIVSAIHAND